MSDTEAQTGHIDVPGAFRRVVELLQTHPERYRWFGIYWWPLKALLRRAGYDQRQLFLLGQYQDPETAAMVPAGMSLEAVLRAAFEEYSQNATFPHAENQVENDEGELVRIVDADAAGL